MSGRASCWLSHGRGLAPLAGAEIHPGAKASWPRRWSWCMATRTRQDSNPAHRVAGSATPASACPLHILGHPPGLVAGMAIHHQIHLLGASAAEVFEKLHE